MVGTVIEKKGDVAYALSLPFLPSRSIRIERATFVSAGCIVPRIEWSGAGSPRPKFRCVSIAF